MNPYRLKALEGLLDYLSGMQGGDLKSLMDESQNPTEGSPIEESMESPKEEMLEDGMGDVKPKGIAVEKVSVMGQKPGEESKQDAPEIDVAGDASDDELDELYKKFRR